jgi:hypothetical protein
MAAESIGQAINKSVLDIQAAADSMIQINKYTEQVKTYKEQMLMAQNIETGTEKVINNLLNAHVEHITKFE